MALPESSLNAILHLLKTDSMVALTGANGERGSGFFIDRDLVLTCAHVVGAGAGETVGVHLAGDVEREGVVEEYLPGNELDLALVRVRRQEGDPSPSAVVLARFVQDDTDYYAVGFPRVALSGEHGLQHFRLRVNASLGADRVTPRSLVLQSGGPTVPPGLSGGALLSPQSGAVVGIVQSSNDTEGDAGGGAIPLNRAAQHLDAVRKLIERPPLAARAWRDALGDDAWRQLGFDMEWQSQVDIMISGTVEKWTIRLEPDGGPAFTLTGQGLPSQVARALFHWAQRRRVHDAEDVGLLGGLLGGALLPEHLVDHVTQAAASDRLFIRLVFEERTELFDVPWEFVRMQYSGGERALALHPSTRLSRVAPRRETPVGGVDLEPRPGPARVLGIVMQPEEWLSQMPRIVDASDELPWPTSSALRDELRKAIDAPGIMAATMLDLEPTQTMIAETIAELDADGRLPVEVVHYVGFGEFDKEPKYALLEGLNGFVRWRPLSHLFDSAAEAGARLLVAEFLSPRPGREPAPVQPQAFLDALRGSIDAVVFTTSPVHPREAIAFNKKLYSELRGGRTIEEAVQAARAEIGDRERPLEEDRASFGWFGLLTGPNSGLRLLEPSGLRGDRTPGERGGPTSPQPDRVGAGGV